ncbi:hypothetical protein PRIO_3122 [Paenibacillus riograndensis SBR5]|uniref:Uncharacterized protein n=1 Tax=Paenibacillus riograndensis SBR5 TaxID=1073571 RepID=A0A0E4HB69_9BACL|nr:hypothetical protein PRIO_3122 [Paenibacillus riograndensis SBR5]
MICTAEPDVDAASRHVCRHRHGAGFSRFGEDVGMADS